MAYSRNPTWKDYPDTSTPITASKLENIESGLVNAATTADSAASQASQAETDAQSAISKANAAQSTANSAQSAATSATNTANAAQSTALSAQNAAQSAQASAQNSANLVNAPADSAIATAVNGSGTQTQAALDHRYSHLGAPVLGSRFLFLGDSITAGSITGTYWGGGFAPQSAVQSLGQIIHSFNKGVSGNTTAQMLSRFDTDVTPNAANFDTLFLLAGTNDSTTDFGSWTSSMTQIVAKTAGIGKRIVMATIPPNNAAAPRPATITKQNAWIRRYAAQHGIPLVDFYKVLVDPATGQYLSGYTADGTHPNPTGQNAMAGAMVNALSPILSAPSVVVAQDSNDPNNLLSNGCFTSWTTPVTPPTISVSTNGSGGSLAAGTYYYKVTVLNYQGESLPSNEVSVTITAGQEPVLTIPAVSGQRVLNIYRGASSGGEVLLASNVTPGNPNLVWTDAGTATPGTATPPTVDYTTYPTGWAGGTAGPMQMVKLTDSAFQGFAARYTSSGVLSYNQKVVTTGFSGGDTLALVCKLRTSGGMAPIVKFSFSGGSSTPTCEFDGASGTSSSWIGLFYTEMVVPSGTTSITAIIQAPSSGSGTIDFGQVGIYNLTTMGVL